MSQTGAGTTFPVQQDASARVPGGREEGLIRASPLSLNSRHGFDYDALCFVARTIASAGSDAVTAEADFLADPVEFMKNNIIRPIIHGFSASIQNFKFTHDTAMEVK